MQLNIKKHSILTWRLVDIYYSFAEFCLVTKSKTLSVNFSIYLEFNNKPKTYVSYMWAISELFVSYPLAIRQPSVSRLRKLYVSYTWAIQDKSYTS